MLSRYRELWRIEEAFRISKHDLKMRPIYHWAPERIKAHIAICFLAFTLVKQALRRARIQYMPMRLLEENLEENWIWFQLAPIPKAIHWLRLLKKARNSNFPELAFPERGPPKIPGRNGNLFQRFFGPWKTALLAKFPQNYLKN